MELNSDFKVITDLNELESFGKAFYLISYKCTNCGKTIPNESKVCPFCTKEIESNEIMDNKENKKKTIFLCVSTL